MRVGKGLLTQGQAVRTRPPRLRIDETGLNHLIEEYACDNAILLDRIPSINQSHPTFSQLVCKVIEPEFGRGGVAKWTATYRGIVADWAGGEPLPPDVLTVESIANQEDIRAHPKFNEMVTSAGADAIRDDDDLLIGFGGTSQFRGVQAYFAPTVIFTRRRFTTSTPTGGKLVGKIDTPPGSLASSQLKAATSQNWLKMSFQTEQFGGVWQTSESWLRSGDNGWNTVIYGEADPP